MKLSIEVPLLFPIWIVWPAQDHIVTMMFLSEEFLSERKAWEANSQFRNADMGAICDSDSKFAHRGA